MLNGFEDIIYTMSGYVKGNEVMEGIKECPQRDFKDFEDIVPHYVGD